MMRRHLLLFDIDRTLLYAPGASMRSMQAVAMRMFGEPFRFEGMNFEGKLHPSIFSALAMRSQIKNHAEHHEAFRAAFCAELETTLAGDDVTVEVMPGINHLLTHLGQRREADGDVMLGLLTGNYALAAQIKLAAVRIDPHWFEITAFGDEGATRHDLVALAMRRYTETVGHPPDPRRIIVIGDTPDDIDCAKAHDCVAFAVATGRFDLDELIAAGADHAVPDLTDPTPLLRLLD